MILKLKAIKQIIKEELENVLSENIEGYKKIITLFESDDLETVKQAIELGEAMGYFTRQNEEIIKASASEDYYDEINVYTCELMCHDENFIDTFMDIHPNGIGGYGYGREGAVYPTDDMELTVYQPTGEKI
tara:strand:+ start:147 stop:539 length:393 start_codon:yes stop_codon:yes gene_type:complete